MDAKNTVIGSVHTRSRIEGNGQRALYNIVLRYTHAFPNRLQDRPNLKMHVIRCAVRFTVFLK